MAPLKYRVRLICASKHVTLGCEGRGERGLFPVQSVLASYGKLLPLNASENGAPLLHYKSRRSVEEERVKDGVWGRAPRKILRTTPSRTSENALLAQLIKVAITIDHCTQMEKWPVNPEAKDDQATLTVPFGVLRM